MSRYGRSRVYYANGEYRDYGDDIPKTGIICVLQWVGGARRTLTGSDYYWVENGEWMKGDFPGMMMYLMEPGDKRVFFGQNVNSHVYSGILKAAHEDPEYPRVTC